MALFTRGNLQTLLASHPTPCISLFMPTHVHHPGTEQDPIRFKNLLKSAESLLHERYVRAGVQDLLEPLANLSEPWFWRYQMHGLALFRSRGLLAIHRLPMRLPELVVVADSFHVKPLLRFLQTNQRYLVLALSQKQVSLYEGTPYTLDPVDLADLPTSMAETLGVEAREPFLNVRTVGKGRTPVFHGHGAPDAAHKDELVRFFRVIDKALWGILREEQIPLILAGVDYYLPIYREVSRYPYLGANGLSGNFDAASPDELYEKVRPLAVELLGEREDEALAAYASEDARGLTSADLATIARLSVQGRVRRLLLAEGVHVWGNLDRVSGEFRRSQAQQDTRDDDILDDLAELVLARGGDILVLPAPKMPHQAAVAALLRW